MMVLIYSNVPVSHDCDSDPSSTYHYHVQYQDLENEAAKWNSVITNSISYLFSTFTEISQCKFSFKLHFPFKISHTTNV